ncbi:MAG: ABC transporter substrate-binding protein [Dehalococcoidia bacterium]
MRTVLCALVILGVLLGGAITACAPTASLPTQTTNLAPTQTTSQPSAQTSHDPYIIGITADLTGAFAPAPGYMAHVLKLYFDEVNKNGGVNGHPVKVILDDSGSDPTKTISQVQSYIDDNACLVYDLASPLTCEAAITKCSAANMPLITYVGVPEAEPPHPNPVVFNMQQGAFSDLGGGLGYAAIIVAKLHQLRSVRVDVIALDNDSERMSADISAKFCTDWGMDVDRDNIPFAMMDYRPIASKIVANNYDMVLVTADGPAVTGLLSAMLGFGYEGLYISSAASPPDIMLNKFKLPNQYYIVDSVLRLDVPPDAQVVARAAGIDQTTFTTQGWSMGQSVELILRQVSWPPTAEKMLAVLNHFTQNRLPYLGPLKWSPDDHIGDAYRQVYTWTKNKGIVEYGPIYKIDVRTLAATENPPELNQ